MTGDPRTRAIAEDTRRFKLGVLIGKTWEREQNWNTVARAVLAYFDADPDTPTAERCARCGSPLREIGGTPPTWLCDNTEGCPGNRDARGETRQP